MYVCMSVQMHVCTVRLSVRINVCKQDPQISVGLICMYVGYVCMYVCTYLCMCVCMYICTYVCVCMYIAHVSMYVCICKWLYTSLIFHISFVNFENCLKKPQYQRRFVRTTSCVCVCLRVWAIIATGFQGTSVFREKRLSMCACVCVRVNAFVCVRVLFSKLCLVEFGWWRVLGGGLLVTRGTSWLLM